MRTTLVFIIAIFFAAPTFAQSAGKSKKTEPKSEEFDPFADYSAYTDEEGPKAEPDYYMRNGRSLTVGSVLGYRSFTSALGSIYLPGTNYGIFLSYFFQMNLAMQIAYVLGDHPIDIKTAGQTFTGNVNLATTAF